ncbi:MAG: penicillin-binding protein activator [Desulfovibrio aminophilus]|jgi:hypothetical protein|uniref:penicillin-binding protein activator n=1 Tax=Desulfovibrio aminophilus TaxID=81425 RepID=UPI002A47ACD7|nr:penicillin-binding protein activator [Desulfovibrionaceae bacterium]
MIFRRTAFAVALTLCAALLFGCAQRIAWAPSAESVNLMTTPQLMQEAAKAYDQRDWARGELYYGRLLERADLSGRDRPLAARRLAESAFESRHYNQSLAALDLWAKADKKAVDDWRWTDLNIRSLAALGKAAALEEQRAWLAGRKNVPWETRQKAALAFFDAFYADGHPVQALQALADAYRLAPDGPSRAALEKDFLVRLGALGDKDLKRLAEAAPSEARSAFPYALTDFERARREAKGKDDWAESWRTMRAVLAASQLESKDVLARDLRELEKKRGVPRTGVALALPLSGRFADVGQKIARGASLAQWALANAGQETEVRVINTEVPGWPARLNELPPHFSLVGGPLRMEAVKEMEPAGLLAKRAFFTFLPSLGDVREGAQAWRFFPSARDQARAAAKLAVDDLGIRNVAVLAPEEKFGRHMRDLFAEEVAARGGHVSVTETYPPGDHPEWGKSVARLLHVPFKSGGTAPKADFGAVFLPDGWAQAQVLIPNFFFHESGYLVFLGPEMWSRALDESRDLEEQYYRLTACSGAWDQESPAARALQSALDEQGLGAADFWVALGYDFVRFAARMGGLDSISPAEVNGRLARMEGFDFSLAPMSWTPDGAASEALHLFQPAKDGKVAADPARMRESIAKALSRRELFIKAANTQRQGKASAPAAVPAAPQLTTPGELDRD